MTLTGMVSATIQRMSSEDCVGLPDGGSIAKGNTYRARRVVCMATFALIYAACSPSPGSAVARPGDALEVKGGSLEVHTAAVPGAVWHLLMGSFRARESVKLVRAVPRFASPGVEVLDARVGFSISSDSQHRTFGSIRTAYMCFSQVPAHLGVLYELKGLQVSENDNFGVRLFVRAPDVSRLAVKGLKLEYVSAGHLYTQESLRITFTVLQAEESRLPEQHCNPKQHDNRTIDAPDDK